MMRTTRLGVLGSGSGSNLQAILNAIDAGELNAEVVLVLCDNPQGYILERAKQRGIPCALIDCLGKSSAFPIEAQNQVIEQLKSYNVDLVCLAGFMRLIKAPILNAFSKRVINIHPSLLPLFPGLAAWEQAIHAKVSESGCTIHFVDEGMDTGEIILQRKVPVLIHDTPETLHQRIQQAEHLAYPEAIHQVIAGMINSD